MAFFARVVVLTFAGSVGSAIAGGWSVDEVMLLQSEVVSQSQNSVKTSPVVDPDGGSCVFTSDETPCSVDKASGASPRATFDGGRQAKEAAKFVLDEPAARSGPNALGTFLDVLIALVICDGVRRWWGTHVGACACKGVHADSAPFKKDAWGCTAFHATVKDGSESAVRELLAQPNCEVDAVDAWEETSLHIAAREGYEAVCRVLLDGGASVNPTNAQGWTPLVVAARGGHEATCRTLIRHGAMVADLDRLVDGSAPAAFVARIVAEAGTKDHQVMEESAMHREEEEFLQQFHEIFD